MWGLLFLGAALGISGIKAGVENAQMMSKPYRYLDDGTPVYLDRKCNEYANGEKIVATYDYKNSKLVYAGQRSGKVYIDPQENVRKRMNAQSEQYKREAIERGWLTYKRYNFDIKRSLSCEVKTDRYIAKVTSTRENGVKRYYKWYLPNNFRYPSDTAPGDAGIEITKEEFDKFRINCGETYFFYDAK